MKTISKTNRIIIAVLFLILAAALISMAGGKTDVSSSPDLSGSNVTYNDYNGKTIGILTGTNMESESFRFFPDSKYLYFDGYPNLNAALLNGVVDAYLGDEPALISIHNEQNSEHDPPDCNDPHRLSTHDGGHIIYSCFSMLESARSKHASERYLCLLRPQNVLYRSGFQQG